MIKIQVSEKGKHNFITLVFSDMIIPIFQKKKKKKDKKRDKKITKKIWLVNGCHKEKKSGSKS